jgi:hypothetical protein
VEQKTSKHEMGSTLSIIVLGVLGVLAVKGPDFQNLKLPFRASTMRP